MKRFACLTDSSLSQVPDFTCYVCGNVERMIDCETVPMHLDHSSSADGGGVALIGNSQHTVM